MGHSSALEGRRKPSPSRVLFEITRKMLGGWEVARRLASLLLLPVGGAAPLPAAATSSQENIKLFISAVRSVPPCKPGRHDSRTGSPPALNRISLFHLAGVVNVVVLATGQSIRKG